MAPSAQRYGRDIVVIGASAGGVKAVTGLAAALPSDLPAAVFLVVHSSPGYPSALPQLLTHRGSLRAAHPLHGEEIVPGRILVAPPDTQLLVRRGYVDVVRGPKESGHRPSVDALFRTAAAAYGPRVVGVVLTGYLDCGTAGLMSIKARGGTAVVQDPREAEVPDMPASAVEHVAVDHVVPLEEIPALLSRLVRAPSPPPAEGAPDRLLRELEGDEPGVPADVVCPQCQGALSLAELHGFQVFRCHVGHTFSLDSLALEQAEELERALWAAVRALEESAAVSRRVQGAAPREVRTRYEEKERVHAQQADVIRRILLGGGLRARASVPGANDTEADASGPAA